MQPTTSTTTVQAQTGTRTEITLQEALDMGASFATLFARPPTNLNDLEQMKVETANTKKDFVKAKPGMVALVGIGGQDTPPMVAPGWTGQEDWIPVPRESHWHNIFVTETIDVVIVRLAEHGFKINYTPSDTPNVKPDGYMDRHRGLVSDCTTWRTTPNMVVPARSQTCLRLISGAVTDFTWLCGIIRDHLTVIQDCTECSE